MIIDGGQVGLGLESTIIDLTEKEPVILRPGFVTWEKLEEVLGKVNAGSLAAAVTDGAPKAPGMKYRHYAPKGTLTIVEGPPERTAAYINDRIRACRAEGIRTGVICTDETRDAYDADLVIEYDPFGEITYASITRFGTETFSYDYDPSTGLFGGHPISELGFDEADLKIQALAARSTRTEAVVAVDPRIVSDRPGTGSAVVFTGSILTGILLGLVLYRKFRRWRKNKKQSSPEADKDSRTGSENSDKNTTAPPAAEEYPELKSMSSGQ